MRTEPTAAPSTFTRPASTCDEGRVQSLLRVSAREPDEVKVALSKFALIALGSGRASGKRKQGERRFGLRPVL